MFKAILTAIIAILKAIREYLSNNELKKRWKSRRAGYEIRQEKRIDRLNMRRGVDRMRKEDDNSS